MRLALTLISAFFLNQLQAQVTVSGTVYDISKNNMVEGVRVVSTGGTFVITDSMGRYNILLNRQDSLQFIYNNKPTQMFSVASIRDLHQFDISIKVKVQSKYSLLQDVKVFSRSYKEDSIENRQTYADIFEYQKPGLESSISPGGVAGADINQLINMFRFRRNRQLKAFQQRLEMEEQEKYIDHRFSKLFVKRVTGLDEPAIDSFLTWYRPSYEFTRASNEMAFNQYILNSSYMFRKLWNLYRQKQGD